MPLTPSQIADFNAPFDFMKFTLYYKGTLRPVNNNRKNRKKRNRVKWEIRRALHVQLEELTETHDALITTIADSRKALDDPHRQAYYEPIDVKDHRFFL
jgi:hypothetical protein